jgi:hypothetical protein
MRIVNISDLISIRNFAQSEIRNRNVKIQSATLPLTRLLPELRRIERIRTFQLFV